MQDYLMPDEEGDSSLHTLRLHALGNVTTFTMFEKRNPIYFFEQVLMFQTYE